MAAISSTDPHGAKRSPEAAPGNGKALCTSRRPTLCRPGPALVVRAHSAPPAARPDEVQRCCTSVPVPGPGLDLHLPWPAGPRPNTAAVPAGKLTSSAPTPEPTENGVVPCSVGIPARPQPDGRGLCTCSPNKASSDSAQGALSDSLLDLCSLRSLRHASASPGPDCRRDRGRRLRRAAPPPQLRAD